LTAAIAALPESDTTAEEKKNLEEKLEKLEQDKLNHMKLLVKVRNGGKGKKKEEQKKEEEKKKDEPPEEDFVPYTSRPDPWSLPEKGNPDQEIPAQEEEYASAEK
jgi:hypothetical protein